MHFFFGFFGGGFLGFLIKGGFVVGGVGGREESMKLWIALKGVKKSSESDRASPPNVESGIMENRKPSALLYSYCAYVVQKTAPKKTELLLTFPLISQSTIHLHRSPSPADANRICPSNNPYHVSRGSRDIYG